MLFISYSSKDRPIAGEIYERLTARGYRLPFLDYHPESGVAGGADWGKELRAQVRLAKGMVVLCSENWKVSDWCRDELGAASVLRKAIIPLNIDGCSLPGTVTAYQQIDFRHRDDEAYNRLWRALEGARLRPEDNFYWPRNECPYPGLPAFEERHAGVYFGREAELDDFFVNHFDPMRATGIKRLIYVVGPSGSGKSSFVRAGVLPRIRFKQSRDTRIITVFRWSELKRDGQTWAERLAEELQRLYLDHPSRPNWNAEERATRYSVSDDESTKAAAQRFIFDVKDMQSALGSGPTIALLILDQFEELITATPPHGPLEFIRFLKHCLTAENSSCRAIATVRSEFLPSIQAHPELLQWNERTDLFRLDLLKPERLYDVVRRPAEVVDVAFESDALVDRIVSEAKTTGALPLLAFTLKQFFETCGGSGMLTEDEYETRLGGLVRCLQSVAEQVLAGEKNAYGQATPPDAAAVRALRQCFVHHLVQYRENPGGKGGYFVRRAASWCDLPSEAYPLLEKMASSQFRLLTKDQPVGRSSEGATVEVTHEALFTVWRTLREWLIESSDGQILRQRVEQLRLRWLHRGSAVEDLIPQGLADEARAWETAEPGWFTAEQSAFLQASRAYHQALTRELIRLKEEAERQMSIAQDRARMAESRRVAMLSETERGMRLDRALLLAVLAHDTKETVESRDAFYRALIARPEVITFLAMDESAVHGVALNPNRTIVAAASGAGVLLFDANSFKQTPPGRLDASEGYVTTLAFSPGGSILAIACMRFGRVITGQVVFFETVSWKRLDRGSVSIGLARSMAFDAQGKTLAMASDNGLFLWDAEKGIRSGPKTLVDNAQMRGSISGVAFHPESAILAVGCGGVESGQIALFDCHDDEPCRLADPLLVPEGPVTTVTFGTDGKSLAAAYSGRSGSGIVLFEVPGWTRIHGKVLSVSEGMVSGLRYHSPSNRLIASFARGAKENGTRSGLHVFDLFDSDRVHRHTYYFPEQSVTGVDFSRDGRTVAVGFANLESDGINGNGGVALLDLTDPRPLTIELPDLSTIKVSSFAKSSDGETLAFGVPEAVRLFSVETGSWVSVPLTEGYVSQIAFSPDRPTVAVAYSSAGGCGIVLIDASDGTRLGAVPILQKVTFISGMSFSTDGRLLATDVDQETLIFDVERLSVCSSGPMPVDRQQADYATGIALRPDFEVFAVGYSNRVAFVKALERTQLSSAPSCDAKGLTSSVCFSPDGQTLAVAFANSDQPSLWILGVATQEWRKLHQASKFGENIGQMLFSPESRTLAAELGSSILMFEVTAEESHRSDSLRLPEGHLERMTFSSSGHVLAVAYGSGYSAGIVLFNAKARRRLQSDPLLIRDGRVTSMTFGKADKTLIVTIYGAGNGFLIFDLDMMSWRKSASGIVNRNLTLDEWQRYCPDEPYRDIFEY